MHGEKDENTRTLAITAMSIRSLLDIRPCAGCLDHNRGKDRVRVKVSAAKCLASGPSVASPAAWCRVSDLPSPCLICQTRIMTVSPSQDGPESGGPWGADSEERVVCTEWWWVGGRFHSTQGLGDICRRSTNCQSTDLFSVEGHLALGYFCVVNAAR